MFLKWSDDLVSSLSSTAAEADIQVTMDAFAAYSGYMTGMIEERKTEPTDDLVSVLVHAEVEGSRLEDHQIVTEVLLLLIGGDETTRHTLSGGTEQLLLPSRAASAPGRRPGPAAQCDRRDAALDGAGEEHGPDHHRRHRIPRHRPQRGREDDSAVRVGQLRRESFREIRRASISTAIQTTTLRSASARTSAWVTSWRGSSCRSCRRSCCSDCRTCAWPPTTQLPLRPANFVSGLEKMPVVFTPTAPLNA